MRIVEEKEVFERLDMQTCIGLMREAFMALESGKAMQTVRTLTRLPHGEVFGFMPAYLGEDDYFGAKIATALDTTTDYLLGVGETTDKDEDIALAKTLIARNAGDLSETERLELISLLTHKK